MKLSKRSTTQYGCLGIGLYLFCLLVPSCWAQQNAVWQNSTTTTPSVAFLDASTFTTGSDICAMINLALQSSHMTYPQGVVIDARGITSALGKSMTCNSGTPWQQNGANTINTPSTILLPDATITILTTWVLPNGTRLMGEQTTESQDPYYYAVLEAGQGFTAADSSNAMIEMGSSTLCPSGCSGISVDHLTLDGGGLNINAIYNGYAQDQSYASDLSLRNLQGTGLYVDTTSSGSATGSGPYANINFVPPMMAIEPVCVRLNAQTKGLRGATCIASNPGITLPPYGCATNGQGGNFAAIYVTAGGNSLEDLHIESYCDGVQVGVANTNASTGGVVIKNVVTAQKGGCDSQGHQVSWPAPASSVHICGPNPHDPTFFGQCSIQSNNISDISLSGITGSDGGSAFALVQDDQTGTTISPPAVADTPFSLGMYSLGENLATSNPPAFALLTTSASPFHNSSDSTSLPTWGAAASSPGNSCTTTTPTTPGTLYSNTACNSGTCTIWVCTPSNGWRPIL